MSTTVVDAASTPLLTSTGETSHRSRRDVLRDETARFLRQVSGRQLISEQSMRVRETVVQQLDERRSYWAYSTTVVCLDLIWNTVLVLSAIVVMIASKNEITEVPVRWWIVGYGVQCVVHMICVCIEYFRLRNLRTVRVGSLMSSNWSFGLESGSDLNLNVESGSGFGLGSNLESNLNSSTNMSSSASASDGVRADIIDFVTQRTQNEDNTSFAKKLESVITKSSFIWWIVGMYWFSSGGQKLADDAPMLYWLTAVFLVLDVVFVVICVFLACLIGIAVCCFLPCIIAFLYTVSDQEGASKAEIERLKKYTFRRVGNEIGKPGDEIQELSSGIMTECNTDTPTVLDVLAEDAVCSICLSDYENGSEIRELPCHHHFHSECIDKWLPMKPTCPLCKGNILAVENGSNLSIEV